MHCFGPGKLANGALHILVETFMDLLALEKQFDLFFSPVFSLFTFTHKSNAH